MDKKHFLARLRAALRWRMPPRELLSVLADYEEYFASGAEEGLTEEALAARFGDPREIAAELAGQRGKVHFRPPYTLVLGVAVAAIIGLLLAAYFNAHIVFWPLYSNNTTFFGLVCLLISGFSLVCCRWDAALRPSRPHAVLAVVLECLAIALTLAGGLICYNAMEFVEWGLARGVSPQTFGPAVALLLVVAGLLAAGSWLWELFAIWRLPEVCVIFFPLNAALLSMVWGSMMFLYNLSDPTYFKQMFLEWVVAALWQLLPLLLLPLLRRKEAPWTAR